MQAIILAAGMGRRLKDLTKDRAKCMITINGITLIERMLRQLDKLALSGIVIVVGFQEQKLRDFISSLGITTQITYVNNPVYDRTNNIYSLSLASDFLVNEDTIILESDLIFEDSVLTELLHDERDTLALVDKYEGWMDGTVVKINADDSITDIISGARLDFSEEDYYKTVNIYKFSKEFSASLYVPFLTAYLHALGNNQYYEQVLRAIMILDEPVIRAKRLSAQIWYEIDNIQDMDIASSLFEPDEDRKLELMQERYGGYWRYPKLIDFCYLVNPFFPPKRMMNEISCNFERLMTSYPSGLGVNTLLATKKYNVSQEYIVIGNGAAELIKSFMEVGKDIRKRNQADKSGASFTTDTAVNKVGLIYPTFEEYPNRLPEGKRVVFIPENENFSYSAEDVINFFADKDIGALVIINPDNPMGNYIGKKGIAKLLDWSAAKNIRLLIDESFVDFSDEYPCSLLDNDLIKKYRNLVVVKSISKSYGVPGLRLGVLASSDTELISDIKNNVSIWNINSFAEFFMQIEEKYNSDYDYSLEMLRKTRRKFISDLSETKTLRVIPSQAVFVAAEILGGIPARELTKTLLLKYNLFIKDLSTKTTFTGGQYIRIAIKTEEDNDRLIIALKEIFGNSIRASSNDTNDTTIMACDRDKLV